MTALAQAKRIGESLKANRCADALSMLQTRLDLCTHAQILKDGDLLPMDSDALAVHLEALTDYFDLFPLDIMIKLATKSCSDTLGKLVKLSVPGKKDGGGNGKPKHQEVADLFDNFLTQAIFYQHEEGVDSDPLQFFEKPDFDPMKPSFRSIVLLILARQQDSLESFDWPSGLAAALADEKQLEERVRLG